MRTNANVQPGQTWRDSDPRRLRLLRVAALIADGDAIVEVLYPPARPGRAFGLPSIPMDRFLTTGPRGLTRMS